MPNTESQRTNEDGSSTAVEEPYQTADPSAGTTVPGRDDNQEVNEVIGKAAMLCHHFMESGFYCQSPAVGGRRFCYSHLRLRGQRIRMARAIAQRLPYHLRLPVLDDMAGVRLAAAEVADALAAGLLEPQRAGRLVYTLQQISCALRWEAQARDKLALATSAVTAGAGAPPLTAGAPLPSSGQDGEQNRLVDEYPGFEAEFDLPAGLDLAQPPHVLFPPPAGQAWPAPLGAGGAARTVSYNDPPPSLRRWTKEGIALEEKEGIALEELEKRRKQMGEQSYCEQASKINGRIEKQVKTQMRKEQEAEWQAEADRRNTFEEKKEQIYRSMDDGQRQAYHLGVLRGLEAAQEQAEAEAARKKPAKNAS